MKKTKILIPALGILAVTVAASVSGTVAWFTANKQVSYTAGSFQAINPSANLEITTAANANTTKTSDGNIVVTEGLKLRDASTNIDAGALTVYGATFTGSEVTGYAVKETPYKYNDAVIYVASWTATFTNKGSAGYEQDVYFNATESTFTEPGVGSEFGKCFRMAMYTNDRLLVWAPTNEATDLTHVISTTQVSAANEGYKNIRGATVPTTGSVTRDAGKAKDNYLCTVDGGASVTVQFVVWYEGADLAHCNENNVIPAASTSTLVFDGLQADTDYAA